MLYTLYIVLKDNVSNAKAASLITLKSCTPMQANMNWRSVVTIMMLPMVRMATNTHCTTCCLVPTERSEQSEVGANDYIIPMAPLEQ